MVESRYERSHLDPQGAGDGRPTATQIVEDEGLVDKMTGKVFFITGATSGIGLQTAQALRKTGADVFFSARTVEKGEQTLKELKTISEGSGKLDYVVMSLDSLESVRQAAKDFLSKSTTLNVLIGNGGVMLHATGKTEDGFELCFGTNHLSHFVLFEMLKPTLLASSTPNFNSRVILVTSGAHRLSRVNFDDLFLSHVVPEKLQHTLYGQSKTANVWMANEIDRKFGARGLHAFSVHPGLIPRAVFDSRYKARRESIMSNPVWVKIMKDPEQGAATSVWASIAKCLEGQGGKYLENCQIAPQLDPEIAKKSSGPEHVGYAEHAYDEEGERKLWQMSETMTGLVNS